MTPLEIEILLHYFYSKDNDFRNLDAPAISDALRKLTNAGLLNKDDSEDAKSKYYGNEKALKLYVDALSKVPLPSLKWTM